MQKVAFNESRKASGSPFFLKKLSFLYIHFHFYKSHGQSIDRQEDKKGRRTRF